MDTREAWESIEPTEEVRGGVLGYLFPDGLWLPIVAGAAPDGDGGDGEGDGDGAGDGDDGAGEGDGGGDGEGDADEDEPLGDAGKKTLKREREWREKAEKAKKAADRKVKALEKELAAAKAGGGTDDEKKLTEARTEAAKAERDRLAGTLRRAAVKSAAAGKMDPDLAAKLVDLDAIDVDDEGEVDDSDARKLVEQLLEAHPELATKKAPGKSGGDPQNGKGSGGGKATMDDLLRAAVKGQN